MSNEIKNVVYVDIDTEREEVVRIGKLPTFTPPNDREEDIKVCDLDIKTLSEGIIKMALYMGSQNYQTPEDVIDDVIAQLKDGIEDNTEEENDNHKIED